MSEKECGACEFAPMDITNTEKPCINCKTSPSIPGIKRVSVGAIREMIRDEEYFDERNRTEKREMSIAKKKIPYEELYALVFRITCNTENDCPVKEEFRECFLGQSDIVEELEEMQERMCEVEKEAHKGFEERVRKRIAKKMTEMERELK